MTPFLSDWLTILLIGFTAVVVPGPNLAIILRNSLVYSRQAGITTAAGLAAGNLIHTTYCLVGIGVIISQSILVFNILKWLGAAYLIYIGIKSLQAKKPTGEVMLLQQGQLTRLAAFRIGFLTNLLNPKVTLFFLALFTQIIRPDTPLPIQAVYGLTMVGLEFGWFACVALFMSQQRIRSQFLSVSHWFERVTGLILIGLGLKLAFAEGKH